MNRKERRLAERSGRSRDASILEMAEGCYRTGRLQEADALCARQLTVEPRHAAALHLRGLIAHRDGRLADASTFLVQAASLAPMVPAAHQALAEAYRALGRMEDAEPAYRRVAELQPNAITLLNLGNVLLELKRPADAASAYQSALRFDGRLPEAHHGFGSALATLGRREAAAAFSQAVALRRDFVPAHEGLVEARVTACAWEGAWQAACEALRWVDSEKLRGLFVSTIAHALPTGETPGLREAMRRALAERWTRPQDLARAACAIIGLTQPLNLQDQLLSCLLELAPVCHHGIERALTTQRRAWLEAAISGRELPSGQLGVACLVARQCFINEYVWSVDADEGQLVEQLRIMVDAAPGRGQLPSDTMLVVLGMYLPLRSLPDLGRLRSDQRPPDVAAVLAQQVAEPAEEGRLRAAIPRATAIEDDVSRAVRDQYEANPYPRWVAMPGPMRRARFGDWLGSRFPSAIPPPADGLFEILVAGCGTGQHPLETIRRFADVKVLALDLSLSSLAYAARMTQALGVTGVEYAQADLLRVAELGRSFDVIEAVGVLHHLSDLWAGWRSLLEVLRPGGIMNISLYTRRGRGDVGHARDWIAGKGYRPTPEGIRTCRRAFSALPDDWARRLSESPDFFSASSCRDLLFHVQEQAVSLPDLSDFFVAEGINLLGVEAPMTLAHAFKAWSGETDDSVLRDLALWDSFEAEHPQCFAGMVNLWLQKA